MYNPADSLETQLIVLNFRRIQILNGRMYYSPNSVRTVEEPSVGAETENPFVPPPTVTKFGIKRNLMQLDVSTYTKPRWWSPLFDKLLVSARGGAYCGHISTSSPL